MRAGTALQLCPRSVAGAISPQLLITPALRTEAVRRAVASAAARVPAGPQHDLMVAAVMRQTENVLGQVFDTLWLSLALAIQRGLLAALACCFGAVLVVCLLRDVSLERHSDG